MVYGRSLRDHVAAAIGIELDFHRWAKICSAAIPLHVFDDMARPAAMGHKRNDRLLLPVLAFQKDFIAGAIVYHHVGVPTAMTS